MADKGLPKIKRLVMADGNPDVAVGDFYLQQTRAVQSIVWYAEGEFHLYGSMEGDKWPLLAVVNWRYVIAVLYSV